MRESTGKYRGKRVDGKGWASGSLIESKGFAWIVIHEETEEHYELNQIVMLSKKAKTTPVLLPCVPVDPETVGEFTSVNESGGYVGTEGEEICEGDMVLLNNHFKVVVTFKGGVFYGYNGTPLIQWSQRKIIGNIHDDSRLLDNPEQLTGGQGDG